MNMGVFPSGQWGQTVNLLLSASVVRIHPRPPRTPVSNGYRSFCFISLEKGDARVDSNSSGADRRLRRKQGGEAGAALRFFKALPRAAEKAASATRKTRRTVRRVKKPLCNSDDRCQRQKQGGAVGAAASRMRVPPKARCSRWEPRPGLLFCAARAVHPRPLKNRNVSKYAAVLFYDTLSCYFCFVLPSEQLC